MERYKYVSQEYAQQLDELAEKLVTSRRFGKAALEGTVEIPVLEIPDNIEIGEE